ncbi:MAG: hypothetical protein ACPGGK_02435 [Pikeienuella sp.]
MADRAILRQVHEDDTLRATLRDGDSDQLVVSFAGIGKNNEPCQPEEFVNSASDYGRHPTLFIMDKKRSWMNAPGLLEKIVELIEQEKRNGSANEVCTIGNSMGGFMSLLIPYFTPVQRAIGFSAQYSVDPSINPKEWRWKRRIERIGAFLYPTLAGQFVDHTSYCVVQCVVHGGSPREAVQLDEFPRHPSITHFVHPAVAHGVAEQLKRENKLHDLVQSVFAGRRRRAGLIMQKTGFVPRAEL